MLTLLLATRNRKKALELSRLFKGVPVRLLTLDRFPEIPPVAEDGATFRANAVRKAVEASRQSILPVLAEDSGLKIQALGGRPGVRSARFAGPRQDDKANIAKLLQVMKKVPLRKRRGQFQAALALAIGGKLIRTFPGSCEGVISLRPKGHCGFGYDPVFIPKGFDKTMAQLGPKTKDTISHRFKAVAAFRRFLLESVVGA